MGANGRGLERRQQVEKHREEAHKKEHAAVGAKERGLGGRQQARGHRERAGREGRAARYGPEGAGEWSGGTEHGGGTADRSN